MNIDDYESSFLAQARSQQSLAPSVQAEKLGALQSRISAGDAPTMNVGAEQVAPLQVLGGSGSSFFSGLSPWHSLGMGLVAGLGVGVFVGLSLAPDEPPALVTHPPAAIPAVPSPLLEPAVAEPRLSESLVVEPVVVESSSVPAPEHASTGELSSPAFERRQRQRREAERPQQDSVEATGPAAPSPSRPTFHEELSYLKQAQAALRAGNPAMAYGLMSSLDEDHPQGALRLERNVTKLLALCGLGRDSEATALGQRLLSSPGSSTYLERLQGSCALPSAKPE